MRKVESIQHNLQGHVEQAADRRRIVQQFRQTHVSQLVDEFVFFKCLFRLLTDNLLCLPETNVVFIDDCGSEQKDDLLAI